jgi:hypothetical protein
MVATRSISIVLVLFSALGLMPHSAAFADDAPASSASPVASPTATDGDAASAPAAAAGAKKGLSWSDIAAIIVAILFISVIAYFVIRINK